MIVGLGLAASLTFLAIAFLLWQLVTLKSAIQDLKVQENRLTLVLETAQQATSLVVVVQEQIAERVPANFVAEVSASLRELESTQDELSDQLRLIPQDDPMRRNIEQTTASLQNMINIAAGTINHAKDENWAAAEVRAELLLKRHSDIEQRINQLIELTREHRIAAETQANEAVKRITSISIPLVIVALLIGATITFRAVRTVALGVEQLSRSARRLAEGYFDERIAVAGQDELGQLAHSFNAMAEELQGLYAGLERQVTERTAELERRSTQLEAAAQVAREAAAIRDVGQLLDTTVRLISNRFGLYHAGIFLLDDTGEYAVLRAASSEGGQRMLARGHKLKVGEVGIVGYASGTGKPRIALDTGADAVFFDNPDLPDTRSEMGLPLRIRDQVIGVLDVQSTEKEAFSHEDMAILQTMADQVALAIENARLLEESQHALQELEALHSQQAREAWRERVAHQPAYRYTGVGVESVPPSATVEEIEIPSLPGRPVIVPAQEQDGRRLVAPIRLRGQTLGSIALRQDPESPPWSDEEIALVEELSSQIGLALENARLLEETQSRARREQTIRQITEQMRRAVDVETILQTTIARLGEAMGAPRVYVRLGAEAGWSSPDETDGGDRGTGRHGDKVTSVRQGLRPQPEKKGVRNETRTQDG